MIGIEAIAFLNPEIDKVQDVFTEVSQTFERTLDDFDRSHSRSITKRQVSLAIRKTDSVIDRVKSQVNEGLAMIDILKTGSEESIKTLELNDNSPEMLKSLSQSLMVGNKRLYYTFFKAESNPAWAPHISHLRYIKARSLSAFEEYQKITEELSRLVELYHFKDINDFSYDIAEMEKSIDSDSVAHPDWVTTGDDFVEWIRSMKKGA